MVVKPVRPRMGRPLALVLLALASGCLAPSATPDAPPGAEDAPHPAGGSPLHLEERLWLPPSAPMLPAVTQRPLLLAHDAAALVMELRLGSTVPGTEAAAGAMVELRDAEGKVVAGAMMMPRAAREATLEATDLPAGEYVLRFETTGASDGRSAGQHLDYVVHAQ